MQFRIDGGGRSFALQHGNVGVLSDHNPAYERRLRRIQGYVGQAGERAVVLVAR